MKTGIIIAIIIVFLIVVFGVKTIKYSSTPQKAVNKYLNSVTSSYKIIDIKINENASNSTQIVVESNDKYNLFNHDNGRKDGVNTHFFVVKKCFLGWYISADNSGP